MNALAKTAAAERQLGSTERLLRRRIADLERIVEAQAEQLEQARRTKAKPIRAKATKLAKGAFCRVVVPDTHGCLVDRDAIAAFLGDLASIRPAEIVLLGDHLECGNFLAEKHTLGYVAQTDYCFEDDVAATNLLLDQIQEIAPGATVDYLEGNHERRIENWCVTHSKRHKRDADYLRGMFSADTVLSIEKRGFRWIRQGVFYDGLSVPATIRKGHCHFTHGSSTATHAASVHVRKFGGNVVYGHTHRGDYFPVRTVKDGTIAAWSPGCLCRLQPLWQHTNPTDWTHGYGLQLVNPDGTFLHINVPIIDGKSFLAPLARKIL